MIARNNKVWSTCHRFYRTSVLCHVMTLCVMGRFWESRWNSIQDPSK